MDMATHEKRILHNLLNKPEVRELPAFVDINMWLGGLFRSVNGVSEYCGGNVYHKLCCWLKNLDVEVLRSEVEDGMMYMYNGKVANNFTVWYKVKEDDVKYVYKVVESSEDIEALIEGRDLYERVTVYVEEFWEGRQGRKLTKKDKGKAPLRPINKAEKIQAQPRPLKIGLSPTRRSPRFDFGPDVVILPPGHPDIPLSDRFSTPTKSPQNKKKPSKQVPTLQISKPTNLTSQKAKQTPPQTTKISDKNKKPPTATVTCHNHNTTPPKTRSDVQATTTLTRTSPRFKQVARKPTTVAPAASSRIVKNSSRVKGTKKKQVPQAQDCDYEPGWSSESDFSDLDVDFDPEEEDFKSKERADEFVHFNPQELTKAVVDAFKKIKTTGPASKQAETEVNVADLQEPSCGSEEELHSLHGSDDEVDENPFFNPKTDFEKKITLTQGLKFRDVETLRKALRYHAIQGHYNYYFLHNGGGRITTYCSHKCQCPWDRKHSKIVKCDCQEEFKCQFKVHARQIKMEHAWQIKTLHTEHVCGYQDANPKVTSEYLADRYLSYFRDNPGHSLRTFRVQVGLDIGVDIGYFKAWYARSRAKFILYGEGALQYGRVYDYATAVLKYNPGSTCIVSCDGVESGVPVFKRFYMCLDVCKKGFKGGCRPIIGVDGCHLKGEYPGMILVAVSKDGNNNIYPIAWSVVEVENKDSWTWFLNLLMEDLDFPEGDGLTVMSDRQKGLLEAIGMTAPKAEVRFCVRHIWANFKLQFPGQAFKEHFWHAARTSNKLTWETQMFIIKELDEDAYEYLADIPERHWCRHAFESNCKSNMLLNNLCESFNNVLKEARDKPIITCMEWIRRYVMKRHFEKMDGVKKQKGRSMPYVGKVFEWVKQEAMTCALLQASKDEWEVEQDTDKHVVNLSAWTCTCYKWQLTGIPCSHAFACLVRRRENPEKYVHDYYSKARYIEAYKESVKPMPGMEHWKKCTNANPLPPPMRKMPGRPSKKKRKRAVGEDGQDKYVKRTKRQNCCSNCGQPGHYKNKCKNATAPPKAQNKGGRPVTADPWCVNRRMKKQARAMAMQYPQQSTLTNVGASDSSQATMAGPSQQGVEDHVIPSQASSAPTPQPHQTAPKQRRPPKLQVKSNAKVPPQA